MPGDKAEDVARVVGVSTHTIYAWKSKYEGMDVSEAQEAKPQRRLRGGSRAGTPIPTSIFTCLRTPRRRQLPAVQVRPSESVRTATTVKPGLFHSMRSE